MSYYLLLRERQKNIYLFQMTRYHPCGIPYCNKVFSLHAYAADQFYITTRVWTRQQIAHVAIANTYTSTKARDVKKRPHCKLAPY